jgi:hypothetical protein
MGVGESICTHVESIGVSRSACDNWIFGITSTIAGLDTLVCEECASRMIDAISATSIQDPRSISLHQDVPGSMPRVTLLSFCSGAPMRRDASGIWVDRGDRPMDVPS